MVNNLTCNHADSNGYEEAQAEEEEADEEDADEDDDEGTPPKKAPNKRKGGGARRAAEPKEPKKRRASTNGSGLTGSALSPALQEFLGLERLARPQVTRSTFHGPVSC
jgi:chromatin remodeling complex protein RSC6